MLKLDKIIEIIFERRNTSGAGVKQIKKTFDVVVYKPRAFELHHYRETLIPGPMVVAKVVDLIKVPLEVVGRADLIASNAEVIFSFS